MAVALIQRDVNVPEVWRPYVFASIYILFHLVTVLSLGKRKYANALLYFTHPYMLICKCQNLKTFLRQLERPTGFNSEIHLPVIRVCMFSNAHLFNDLLTVNGNLQLRKQTCWPYIIPLDLILIIWHRTWTGIPSSCASNDRSYHLLPSGLVRDLQVPGLPHWILRSYPKCDQWMLARLCISLLLKPLCHYVRVFLQKFFLVDIFWAMIYMNLKV